MDPFLELMFRRIDEARGPGSDMAAHMPLLYSLGRLYSFAEVVECGTRYGFSTHALLSGVVENKGHMTSYDLDVQCGEMAAKNMGLDKDDPIRRHWTFVADHSVEALKKWSDGSVSLLFLDTSHDYEMTVWELRDWLPKIHVNGIICGHDYYLHLTPGWEGSGVKRAVDEFASKHEDRFRLQVFPHDKGLFILWPKG